MIELIVAMAMAFVVSKVASADGKSSGLWWVITFALCLAVKLVFPWPFLRIGLAGVLSFFLMFGSNFVTRRAYH